MEIHPIKYLRDICSELDFDPFYVTVRLRNEDMELFVRAELCDIRSDLIITKSTIRHQVYDNDMIKDMQTNIFMPCYSPMERLIEYARKIDEIGSIKRKRFKELIRYVSENAIRNWAEHVISESRK